MSWRHHRLTIFHGTLRVDITTQAAGPLFSSGSHFYRFLKTCQEWNFFQLGMTVSVFHFSSVFHDTCFLSFIRSTCSTYGCDDSIFFSLYAMEKCLFCQTVNHVEWYGILMLNLCMSIGTHTDIHMWIGLLLVYLLACHLFSTKPSYDYSAASFKFNTHSFKKVW